MKIRPTYGIENQQPPPRPNSFRIGEAALAIHGLSLEDTCVSRELEAFSSDVDHPEIDVAVEWVHSLRSWHGEKTFDSGGVWSLFRDARDLIFDFVSPVFGDRPYKRVCADRNFRSVQLILNRQAFRGHSSVYPLDYPADELLITNYLASGTSFALGVEVHGCGLVDSETGGHLLLGHSGAGKSTTTKLWKSFRDPEILSDDRIILRIHEHELWMYGTPWHGEAAFASPGRGRINKICILQHGERNRFTELPRARAVGELFARCFPPFHSAQGLANTIDFLNRIASLVPIYEFQFVPNRSAVDAVLGFHD